MATFRILDLAPSYRNLQGDATASGGTLYFYETGTVTPKAAYTAKALTGAMFSIGLDSAGRTNGDVWGDGTYRVTLKDALGATIWTRDDVELPGGASQVVPVPNTGQFLTGDGTNFALVTIREVPDPTGQANKILGTDGTTTFWVVKPTDGTAGTSDTSSTTTSFRVGLLLVQTGTASAPASASKSTSLAVTFPTAFSVAPIYVGVQPTGGGVTPSGCFVRDSVTTQSATAFTAGFSTTTGGTSADNYTGSNITSAVAFKWIAVGAA